MNKKHELDFKLKIIKEYKKRKIGYNSLSSIYDSQYSLLRTWVYHLIPIEGLVSCMTRKRYSTDEI